MAQVKILIEGFTSADSAEAGDEEKTCPTITLVRDKGVNIIVDPGVLDDQQILMERLKNEGLGLNDVDIVFITHSHADHYRNAGMFPRAKLLEFWALWDGGRAEEWTEQFSEDVRIIKTPGHNYDGLTMMVKTDEGVVAICGDVFWKENFPEVDSYASDNGMLKASRQAVLATADWIIPGHAGKYRVKK